MRGGMDHFLVVRYFVDNPPPHELAYFHSSSRPAPVAAVVFAVVSPRDVLFAVSFFHFELTQMHHTRLACDVDDLAFGMLFYNIGWFDIFHIERDR